MFPLKELQDKGLECRLHDPVMDYVELRELMANTRPIDIPVQTQSNKVTEVVEIDTDISLVYYLGKLDRISTHRQTLFNPMCPHGTVRGSLLLPHWTNGIGLVDGLYVQLIELLTGVLEIHWSQTGFVVKIVMNIFGDEDTDD